MQQRSKKRVQLRQGRPEVWVNPDIRKLLSPYHVSIEYPEMKSGGFGKALLQAHSEANSADKA